MTEDGAEHKNKKMQLSALFMLSRTNPDGSGSGTSVTYFSTNSTGQLAFLDNLVAIGQVEYSLRKASTVLQSGNGRVERFHLRI